MKAVTFYKFGEPENLKTVETDIPKINDNEILIKVKGAGINPVDAKTRKGLGFVAESIKLPWILGYDVSGKIVEKGKNIKNFKINDNIFGMVGFALRGGCYAEYVIAKENEIVIAPKNIELENASAIPLAALTAYQGLFEVGNLQKNQKILIHSGAGGVGHFAVQFAKEKGAYVISTASEKNRKFLLSLGADEIIDYENEDFTQKVNELDFVFDLMGFDIGIKSINILKNQGTMVTVPTITAEKVCDEAKNKDVNVKGMKVYNNTNHLLEIKKLIEKNKIKVEISKKFSLHEAVMAHEEIETGKTKGKIILKI